MQKKICLLKKTPSATFFALLAKKKFIMPFWTILGNFGSSVVALVTFSSNLLNFEKNPKKFKTYKNNPKKFKNLKNSKKLKIQKKIKKVQNI